MGKKKSSAPSYATATYSTDGLFGTATANKKGVTFKATEPMQNIGNTAWSGWQDTLNSLSSGDYSQDKNYQVYANNLQNQMTNNFNNSVLSNMANKGLMRSSGLQSATNNFANTLNNQTAQLYDSYTNRLNQNLANYQNSLGTLYNYMTGIGTGAQNQANNVSQYNLAQAQANSSNDNALWGQLASAGAQLGGTAMMAFSDKRVKTNIKKIGEKNGYNWYEFEYKDEPNVKHEGVIAQEVEKVNPDAVIEENGIKKVNYTAIGLDDEVK